MPTLLGNICLALAALISGTIIISVVNYKSPHGGHGGVEAFPIWMLLLHAALLCLMAIAAIEIIRKGGFDWVASNQIIRYLLVFIALIAAIFTSNMSALMLHETGSTQAVLRFFLRYAFAFIPVITVLSGLVLHSNMLREVVPAWCYQWPLAAVLVVSLITVGADVAEQISKASEGSNTAQRRYESSEFITSDRLQEIEESDITVDLVRILSFTSDLYPSEVRTTASAKIKTHPNWQQELIGLLEDDRAIFVFNFLEINEVDDKKRLLQPVNTGILSVADWVRHTIQGTNASQLRNDLLSDDVGCVLRTLEKFEGMGTDYLPAVRALRAACDEPRLVANFKLDCAATLDNWIEKHQ